MLQNIQLGVPGIEFPMDDLKIEIEIKNLKQGDLSDEKFFKQSLYNENEIYAFCNLPRLNLWQL